MAEIRIEFSHRINRSVGIGDIAYVTETSSTVSGYSGSHTHSQQSDNIPIGIIIDVQYHKHGGAQTFTMPFPSPTKISWIVIDDEHPDLGLTSPNLSFTNSGHSVSAGDFIMFSKNNKVNLSSTLGYYAKIKMINNSNKKCELFSVGAETTESSK